MHFILTLPYNFTDVLSIVDLRLIAENKIAIP